MKHSILSASPPGSASAEQDGANMRFDFVESTADLPELLEKARLLRDDLDCFFLIDQQSAKKNAVLTIEVSQMCPEDEDPECLPNNWEQIKHLCNLEAGQLLSRGRACTQFLHCALDGGRFCC